MSSTTRNSSRTLYFAYGSNLHLKQMATRCPESRFIGLGILRGYRWQINERGYANVVEDSNMTTEGLCYLLSAKDEDRLDRNEGVHIGAYEKAELEVELVCRPAVLVGQDVVEIVKGRALEALTIQTNQVVEEEIERKGPSSWATAGEEEESNNWPCVGTNRGEIATALVYLSTTYKTEGKPHEEYVSRMNAGIKDALVLGMSSLFVASAIRPYIDAEPERLFNEAEATTDTIER
ncbi:hypothetical protein IFR05_001628 [Cadophora sp. M221]|nr:hypothetical protein IFR05_001628 [Cadophora sp. M221]